MNWVVLTLWGKATALSYTKCTKQLLLGTTSYNIILSFFFFFFFFYSMPQYKKLFVPRSVEVKRKWLCAAPLVMWLQSWMPNGSERQTKLDSESCCTIPDGNKHLTCHLNAYYQSGAFNGNSREPWSRT